MPSRRVREVLDMIQEVLKSDDGKQLWDILTALRGPDNEDDELKEVTTAVIRANAFPKLVTERSQFPSFVGQFGAMFAGKRQKYVKQYTGDNFTHFGSHSDAAARALGLIPKEED